MLMVSSMTQIWMSLGARARARAREREREREKSDGSKIALEQKEKKTERDRETNREGSIWRAVYGDVRSAMCRTIHTAMDRTILSYV